MHFSLTRKVRVLGGLPRRLMLVDRRVALAASAVCLMEPLEGRMMLSTYYVSNSGNDANSGTSPAAAWRTIGKANGANLEPGDSLLFQGGQTFNGNLVLGSNDSGSAVSPVTISSYGSGRATLNAGTGRGVNVSDSQYFNINNLIFVGAGPTKNNMVGIKLNNDTSATYNRIYIDNVDVSGFGSVGIELITLKAGGWYNDVRITNSNVYNNQIAGIYTQSQSQYGIENLYIGHTNSHDNPGTGNLSISSGSGIQLAGVNGGVVEYCSTYGNGVNSNGGCGVWSSSSNDLLFQYDDSYSNRTRGGNDGDGFDFDEGTSNSIMQYNYATDNDGNGYQLNNWVNNTAMHDNVIRYNIAESNGQANNYAGLDVWGRVIDCAIYGNDVYVSTGPSPYGIKIQNGAIENLFVDNLQVFNNIFVTTGFQPLMFVSGQELSGATDLEFHGNDYYSIAGTPNFTWGGYFSNINDWQNATGQEMSNGVSTGLYANPDLVNIGSAGVVSDANLAGELTAYTLEPWSPLIDAGVNIATPSGVVPATSDFFGDVVPQGQAFDIGAYESGGILAPVTNPPPIVTPPPVVTPPPPVVTPPPVTNPSPTAVAVPSAWNSQDIGAVTAVGSSVFANGTYTISASGPNINDSADAFHYDYTSLSGDGTIVAQITNLGTTSPWSKAGVMVRAGTAANAAEVSMLVSPNGYAEFEVRAGTNQTTVDTEVVESGARWEKLVRAGNTFTGYVSKDGKTWIKIGSTTVVMSSPVEIGLAVTSRLTPNIETAVFGNVSIS